MKRFLIAIVSPLKSPLLLLSIALVYFLHISEDITGDIGKLGQIIFSKEYHYQDKFQSVPMSVIDWCDASDLKSKKVVFLGDSFTKNIYPNCLVSIIQKPSSKYFAYNFESPEDTFVALCNANVEMPDVVVLESVERNFVFRLCNIDFSSNIKPKASVYNPVEEMQTDFSTFYKNQLIKNKAILNVSLRDFSTFYKNQLIKNKAILNVSLRDGLFSCSGKEKELYFYYEDLSFPEEEQIQTAISNLDSLFQLAKKKNICLFYVVAADKYDVYQEFAVDNRFPEKTLLDNFSSHESNPYFVNTKHVLLKNARQGVKDLYYADDTHWSPIGAKIVAEEIARRMDSLGVLRN